MSIGLTTDVRIARTLGNGAVACSVCNALTIGSTPRLTSLCDICRRCLSVAIPASPTIKHWFGIRWVYYAASTTSSRIVLAASGRMLETSGEFSEKVLPQQGEDYCSK